MVENLPAMRETLVRFLGQEIPLEKGSATHSSVFGLPWWLRWFKKIHLQWGRPGFDLWVRKIPWRRATHSSVLAWRLPWTEELAGYSPWVTKGRT